MFGNCKLVTMENLRQLLMIYPYGNDERYLTIKELDKIIPNFERLGALRIIIGGVVPDLER